MSNIRIFEHKDGENILVRVEEKVAVETPAADPAATEELVSLSTAEAAAE